MQIMPRDGIAADDICKYGLCYADRPTTKQLRDPEFNIDFGIGYLADLIDQENGSLRRDALRRYGPSEVGYAYADTILSLYSEVAP